ncbi:GGDEF domain-containing protein [Acidicapsa dinghuensis]|uniref:diguanylate cyclase n=1 Tax=Acidicapsa dinghuensis TaxID=2218256 RepID=A0ABW1EHQ6_9BACT|nr:GGDEF domain-containing protein [Acidicapsa dinghuensis]
MQASSRLWIGAAAALAFAQACASAFLPGGLILTAVSDVVSTVLILLLVIAFARNALASQGRLRSVWILQSLGWFLWLVDQCFWMLYDVILRRPMPEMFPGDVILFLAGVPMLAGLLLRPHLLPSTRSIRLGFLDFLQLMLWWIYIYLYFVMCWIYVSEDPAQYNINFDRLYLAQFVILLAVLVPLFLQSSGQWKRFYACFLAASTLNCLSVVAENTAIEAKTYYNGSWYDVPFAASFVFFLIVAVISRDLTPTLETDEDQRYNSWLSRLAVVAVLSLPVIVVAAVNDRSQPPAIVHFRIVLTAITMFILAILMFLKQHRLHQDLRQTNHILEEASMTDPLTGIRNRRFFSTSIESDIARTLRAFTESADHSTRDLIFYLIDLDNFKEVNDQCGHDAGDRVLVETARRLQSAIRATDVLMRWGGEEFLIVSRSADRRFADALALRVMRAVRTEPFAVNTTQTLRRTCSIGWAAFPWLEDNVNAFSYEEVLNLADQALIQAKESGKDQAIGMIPSHGIAQPSPGIRPEADGLSNTLLCRAAADLGSPA